MTLLVASTVAPYKPLEEQQCWLEHAEAWKEAGHEFFLAAELPWEESSAVVWPGRLRDLVAHLEQLDAEVWSFMLDTNERELTTAGRLGRICAGRNLAHEFFNRDPLRWEGILFLDTDVVPPADAPERLLEVDRQLVGFHVPMYALDGPKVVAREDSPGFWLTSLEGQWYSQADPEQTRPFPEGADVRQHWNTAGAIMVRSEAARALRWRWDLAAGQTDDPCFQEDAERMGFGMTWVRHDVVGRHVPEMIWPLEQRGLDLSL